MVMDPDNRRESHCRTAASVFHNENEGFSSNSRFADSLDDIECVRYCEGILTGLSGLQSNLKSAKAKEGSQPTNWSAHRPQAAKKKSEALRDVVNSQTSWTTSSIPSPGFVKGSFDYSRLNSNDSKTRSQSADYHSMLGLQGLAGVYAHAKNAEEAQNVCEIPGAVFPGVTENQDARLPGAFHASTVECDHQNLRVQACGSSCTCPDHTDTSSKLLDWSSSVKLDPLGRFKISDLHMKKKSYSEAAKCEKKSGSMFENDKVDSCDRISSGTTASNKSSSASNSTDILYRTRSVPSPAPSTMWAENDSTSVENLTSFSVTSMSLNIDYDSENETDRKNMEDVGQKLDGNSCNGTNSSNDYESESNFSFLEPKSLSTSAKQQHKGRMSPHQDKKMESKAEPDKKQFFDPKRIFASKTLPKVVQAKSNKPIDPESIGSESVTTGQSKRDSSEASSSSGNDVLNNGRPSTLPASGANLTRSQIINNLCDVKKHTNLEAEQKSSEFKSNSSSSSDRAKHSTGMHSEPARAGKVKCSTASSNGSKEQSASVGKQKNEKKQDCDDSSGKRFQFNPLLHIQSVNWKKFKGRLNKWVNDATRIVWNVVKLIIGIALLVIFYLIQLVFHLVFGALRYIFGKIKRVLGFKNRENAEKPEEELPWNRVNSQFLSENIVLPDSGEEAIRRLFACKGQDPYSILGLKPNCTDEEIRKYYRRQAVLVHPDKNCEPGAEDAFKILSRAFEIIGEPDKRQEYDIQTIQERETNAAMQQFADLLTKLHETMKESIHLMSCVGCQGKHKRIPTDRPNYAARYCDQCDIHHSAREGDIWAESSMFGLRKKFYACMEYDIYDITDWAYCQGLKKIPANSHKVCVKMGQSRNRNHPMNESDLTDLLSRFAAASCGGGDPGPFPSGASYNPRQQTNSKKKRKKRR